MKEGSAQIEKHKYPFESAGRLLVSNVPIVSGDVTVAEAERTIVQRSLDFETINYLYVTDSKGRLSGVVSLKELFGSEKSERIKSIMQKEVISARAHTDQERIAYLALTHNIKSVPVVDKDNVFLGVVPADVIFEILDSEAVENVLRFGGVLHSGSYDDINHMNLAVALKHRLPWLALGLVGGMASAGVVGLFEEVLGRSILLAAFIPLIVYMAGAVSAQMQVFLIRDLAVNTVFSFKKYFARQMLVVFFSGVVLSILLFFSSWLFWKDFEVSMVLGMALFVAVVTSLGTGLMVPYLFSRFKFDPANASGPIATILQDMISVFVYFLVASWIL